MNWLLKMFLLGAALLSQPFLFAQTTIVSATKVLDNTGALLSSGQLCIGSTCFPVTNGAITSGLLASTTGTITVTNGGSTTYLTLPNVAVSGAYWNFDNYIVPGSASITGIGTPRIACQPGAVYTQTDGDQNKWVCVGINGVGTWNGVVPPPSGAGGGTVTSIGINFPSIFCPTGPNPITSSGTIVASLCDAPANKIFAGPNGSTGTPGFRSLVVSDMPFSYSGNTATLATVSGGLSQGVALTVDANGNIVSAGSSTVIPGTISASQVTGLASSATIDTTNASNITSGTLSLARLPSALFKCPTGQVVGSFALNNPTPTCVQFQGVIASGQQYEIPTYTISGYGTTLGPSLATVDLSGNISAANITASGTLTGAALNISGSGSVGGTFSAGGAISGTTISGTGLSISGSFPANQVYASPNGSAGNLGLRSIVAKDLPFTYSGNTANLATVSGALTPGHGVKIDASGNLEDSGSSSSGCTSTGSGSYCLVGGVIFQSFEGASQADVSGGSGNPSQSLSAPAQCPNAILGVQVSTHTASGETDGDDTHGPVETLVSATRDGNGNVTVITQRYRLADHGSDPSSPVVQLVCY